MAPSRGHRQQLPGRRRRDRDADAGRLLGPLVRTVPHGQPAARADRRRRDDVRVVKLNVDDNQQTAAQFGVMSIPTMILFKNGQAVNQIVGALPKPRIEQRDRRRARGVAPPPRRALTPIRSSRPSIVAGSPEPSPS